MKRTLYYAAIFLSVCSIVILLVGGWYILLTRSSADWLGSVVAAYTGGILGITGGVIREWLQQLAARRRRREDIRYNQLVEIRDLLNDLQDSLIRLRLFLEARSRGELLSGVAPEESDVDALWQRYKAVPNFLDTGTKRLVQQTLREGLLLLLDQRISLSDIDKWEEKCNQSLASLDRAIETEI